MKDNDFVETISMVSLLVKETFELDNIMKPEEFFSLWNLNKHRLQIDERIKDSHEGKMCFYNHYLMYKLLAKAQMGLTLTASNDRRISSMF